MNVLDLIHRPEDKNRLDSRTLRTGSTRLSAGTPQPPPPKVNSFAAVGPLYELSGRVSWGVLIRDRGVCKPSLPKHVCPAATVFSSLVDDEFIRVVMHVDLHGMFSTAFSRYPISAYDVRSVRYSPASRSHPHCARRHYAFFPPCCKDLTA